MMLDKVKLYLRGIKDQPAEVEKYTKGCDNQATFGLIKRQRDNDMELHTDQQVTQSGSSLLHLNLLESQECVGIA